LLEIQLDQNEIDYMLNFNKLMTEIPRDYWLAPLWLAKPKLPKILAYLSSLMN